MADEATPVDQDKETTKSTKDLDKVTDYVEERELNSEQLRKSMNVILAGRDSERNEAREEERLHVKIHAEDVEVIMKEFDLDKRHAERALRENQGDLERALDALVQ